MKLRNVVLLLYFAFVLIVKSKQHTPITLQAVIFREQTTETTNVKPTKVFASDTPILDYSTHRPYGQTDYVGFLEYWLLENDGIGKVVRACKSTLPIEVVVAKMWFESHGGHSSLAKKDPTALFGIKGKNGVKGYDSKDAEKVQYMSYPNRAASIKFFNDLLTVHSGWSSSIYKARFLAWSALTNKQLAAFTTIDDQGTVRNLPLVTSKTKQPDWYYWMLAMQAHPSSDLSKSEMAYANNGWTSQRINNRPSVKMRQERLFHAQKLITFVLRDDVFPIINEYYKKYGNEWKVPLKEYGKVVSVDIDYKF